MGRVVNLGNGWSKEIKISKTSSRIDLTPMVERVAANIRRASNPFIGMKVSNKVLKELSELQQEAINVVTNAEVGKCEANMLYTLLPWRCKIGFHLLRTVRIPFLVYLFDQLWFQRGGHDKKKEIRWAKETLVTDMIIKPAMPAEFISVRLQVRDKQ